ncbi:MAG TPA: ADP-ribosylglycohydrolase family protein [Haliangiales bacterium]|nr:ADP-ribosylglycohydrolase family protein [Haliangiales bacterium]
MTRAEGALLGLAVGDALGTTLEFSAPAAPPFPALARGPHDDIVGGGPFRVAPGQVTDDTQLAACLATSLRERGGFDAADAARRYVAWRPHAFDIGRTTLEAIELLAAGRLDAGRAVWDRSGGRAAANGSLMRTAPIGVFFAADAASRRAAALADSALTHFDPRCRMACAAFDAAVAEGVRGGTAAAMAEAAWEELDAAAEHCADDGTPRDAVAAAVRALRDDLRLARADDPDLYGEVHLHRHEGYVRVAFRLAFWELLHAPDLRAGLIDAVNRGGDADTNGAIAGALLGARHGADGIPASWRERVLGALAGDAGPLATLYHPRELLRLAAT